MKSVLRWAGFLTLLALVDVMLVVAWIALSSEHPFGESFLEVGRFFGGMILLVKLIIELPLELSIFAGLLPMIRVNYWVWSIVATRLVFGVGYALITGMLAIGAAGFKMDGIVGTVLIASLLSPFILIKLMPKSTRLVESPRSSESA